MKTMAWVIGGVVVVLLFLATFGKSSPELDRAHALQATVDAKCDEMMSDSALGAERRMTREMCERLKAEAQRRLDEARATAR